MVEEEKFLEDYPDYDHWEKFFFNLSKGKDEIKLSQLQNHVKPHEVKMKKEFLKIYIESYIKVVAQGDYNEDGTVTLHEWLAWINQKKQDLDR